ncbi:MAG: LUD domain-containing protein [Puniceicoccaceae bacterium]
MDANAFFDPIRKATAMPDDAPRTALPDWDASALQSNQQPALHDPTQLWQCFKQHFEAVHGETVESFEALAALLQQAEAGHGYLAPELHPSVSPLLQRAGISCETELDASRIDSYAFGITRAAGIIAETGSIVLKEHSTPSRLGALAPWIHIAVLDESTQRYATLLDAIMDLGDDPYVVFVTGPSKTADVEGILIEGVHGPGRQICWKS